jgi:hypothetical protein
METKDDVNRYVMRWHADRMTEVEKRAQQHLFVTLKATMGRSDITAQQECRESNIAARFLSNDPEVLHLASEGYHAFVERTAGRILAQDADKLTFNRCPKCNGLARTPTSKQCRFCRHDWHSDR